MTGAVKRRRKTSSNRKLSLGGKWGDYRLKKEKRRFDYRRENFAGAKTGVLERDCRPHASIARQLG